MSESLFMRTLDEQRRGNQVAIDTIEAGRREIEQLEQLASALNARGLRCEPLVTVQRMGSISFIRLTLHVSSTSSELADAKAYLEANGVDVVRLTDLGSPRERYRVCLSDALVEMVAHIHRPRTSAERARVAA